VKALPDLAAAHVLLANIKLKLRDAPGALHEYQEYLRIEPQGTMAPQVRDMVDKLQKAFPTSHQQLFPSPATILQTPRVVILKLSDKDS